MTKLMTWTLHAPNSSTFETYRDLAPGEPWNSKNWRMVNPDAMKKWDYRKRGFIEMIEKYPEKFYAIGLHQFGVNVNGQVYNMGYGTHSFDSLVLNADKTAIALPFEKSLRYLIHTYPQIKWSLQFLCTTNSVGNRVEPVLDNANGAQDTFIEHVYHTMRLYLEAGFTNIKGVEIDFEKTTSRAADHTKFRDLLVRVKNEVCIPLGMELRVNMFAMTGDFNPSYYGWHDYATLASGRDKNGNQAINEFQLMSYDFSWGGSAPGPSTPLWWLKNVLEHVRDLENRGIWRTQDVFIGNAGYGRRWPLGEIGSSGNYRYGVTMDYKQLMLAQNGTYIHNPGSTSIHNGEDAFWFNDQDFIPISGFNDEESDYQRTYLGVYDRFKMTKNGGAKFLVSSAEKDGVNQPAGTNYVTNYSRRQYPVFSGVVAQPQAVTTGGADQILKQGTWEATKSTGLSNITFEGYAFLPQIIGEKPPKWDEMNPGKDWEEEELKNPDNQPGKATYSFNASGSHRLIAAVRWPFFDQAKLTVKLNGTPIEINGAQYDWNPFMQAQEAHFVDLGVRSFNGSNEITVEDTHSAQIFGFVICSDFDYNLRGGQVTFPTITKPMAKRGNIVDNEVVLKQAQYPDVFRIVGEILTRTPRPAIIWEDMFGSYVTEEDKVDITPYRYYPKINGKSNQGYTVGDWHATNGQEDFDYAFNDARNTSCQLMLNHKMSTNIAVDLEFRGDASDSSAIYGVRALATEKRAGEGYACVLDYGTKTVKVLYETGGSSQVIHSAPMSATLAKNHGKRMRMRVYVVNGKISVWIEQAVYFDRVSMPYAPSSGAYGAYNKNNRMKLYKFNISSLDRYERMERVEIIAGGQTYGFNEVERLPSTVFDEFGFIDFTGYPAEIANTVADIGDPDGGGTGVGEGAQTNTILDTQVNRKFEWSNDYKNKMLTTIPSWQGKQDVTIRFKDAGIWFRNFYVGDNEGMSVAYNSDRVGFIKTANFVNEYNCKGIALWTLGQEDPTIYSYITG